MISANTSNLAMLADACKGTKVRINNPAFCSAGMHAHVSFLVTILDMFENILIDPKYSRTGKGSAVARAI